MKKFCGEIQYERSDVEGWVHSDICYRCGDKGDTVPEMDEDYKQFLVACLKEWLDNSNGTGYFWVGDYKMLTSNE